MDSPVQNRRSRKIAPICHDEEEIVAEDLFDLEDERLRSRQLAENEFQNFSSSNKRLSVSEKTVSEHFHSCIQLAAENKINAKNAFSFKLIDLLHSMFSKKKPIKDFTEVSSSLDAGVKIYSCRVDNVHSDTLKMATTVCSTNNGRGEDTLEAADDENNEEKRKKVVRKTKKTTIAKNKEIDRPKINENEIFTYSILRNDNFITNSAIFDGNKVCWHLNTWQNFWESEKPVRSSCDYVPVDIPTIPDDVVISSTFENFKFGEETSFIEPPIKEKMSAAFEIDFEANNDEFFDDDISPQNDTFETKREFIEPKTHVACLSKVMSSSDFVMEISKLITTEKSDYRYFNFQELQKKMTSRNTQHWVPQKKKSINEVKRVKEEKKEPIDFENNIEESLKIFRNKKNIASTITTVTPREKFLITPVTHFSVNKFFKLNVWQDMFVIPNTSNADETPSDLEDMIQDYDYDNPNDTQNTLPLHYEDDYCDVKDDDHAPNDIHEVIEKTMFFKENLIEVPNKVSKIQLPYMVKDKSVNMKDLKMKIWKQIEVSETITEIDQATNPVSFLDICQTVVAEEISDSKQDLSIPILFNAILQLANDKNLALYNPRNDQSNFVVSVEAKTC